jgi:hypothetical protein
MSQIKNIYDRVFLVSCFNKATNVIGYCRISENF